MAQLIIDNKTIDTSIYNILLAIRKEAPGFLDRIKQGTNNILCTCPFHANHKERHVSCGVNVDSESEFFGTFHCFACKETGNLDKFVSQCFNCSIPEAKQWLIDNFADGLIDYQLNLPEIELKPKIKNNFIDESILNTFEDFHPYMLERKLTRKVIDKFEVKYDSKMDCIVFPIRDEKGRLAMLTKRSVKTKIFFIDSEKEKPVYLLYHLLQNNIQEAYVCESQINALTLFTHCLPGIGLIGTGSQSQFKTLNRSNIRVYNLMFDGDEAGDKAIKNFIKNIRKDVIVNIIRLPRGKDVNDLGYDELEDLISSSL